MTTLPAIEGWFTTGDAPRLLGSRCGGCGAFFFPKELKRCRNPRCDSGTLKEAPLSRRGRLWSWTTNHYAPPAPYIAPDPFVPYTIAAVELPEEKLVVLGLLDANVDAKDLVVGRHMELCLGTLYEDADGEKITYQWRPTSDGAIDDVAPEATQLRPDLGNTPKGEVAVLGVGMHPWGKWGRPFTEYGVDAAHTALADAGLGWGDVQLVVGGDTVRNGYPGYVAGATFSQALGWTGAKVMSCYGACATGGQAIGIARAHILAGLCDVALVVGADTAPKGFFAPQGGERWQDPDWLRFRMLGCTNPSYFAFYARRRMALYGATDEDFAQVKVKNARHGFDNPNARYKKRFTLEQVLASPMVSDPLRLFEICATSDGGAAIVLTSLDFARKHTTNPVKVAAVSTATPTYPSHIIEMPNMSTDSTAGVGAPDTPFRDAIGKGAYEEAALGPEAMDLAEVYDLSSALELDWVENLGLCAPGDAEKLLRAGDTTIGGKIPINPSGGLACFGEAVPAQAMAQVCELTWQLRGEAEGRQVEDAKVGITANQGLFGHGSSVIVKRDG